MERYPLLGPRASLLAEHDACGRFPERTLKGLVARAHVLGLHVRAISAPEGRNRRVERKVLWSHEPEMTAWMLEHDHGQRTAALSEAFRYSKVVLASASYNGGAVPCMEDFLHHLLIKNLYLMIR